MATPAFRAGMVHEMVGVLEGAYPDVAVQVQRAIRDELAAVKRFSRMEWIELGLQMKVVEAIAAALGDARFRDYQLKVFNKQMEVPLLKPLAQTAVRLFRVDVAGMIKWIPRGWELLSRDVATLTHEPGSGKVAGRMVLTGFPVEHFRSGTFVRSNAYSYAGVFDLVRTRGHVDIVDEDKSTGSATFEFVLD